MRPTISYQRAPYMYVRLFILEMFANQDAIYKDNGFNTRVHLNCTFSPILA